jgi:midasin
LVPLLQQSGNDVYWLATCFEFLIEISVAMDVQSGQATGVETLKPSKMNRLQRSLVRGRVPAVAKDSTVNVCTFLTNCLTVLKSYVQCNAAGSSNWKIRKQAIFALMQYWWDTYHLATSSFEEATFQAHLAIGRDLLTTLAENTENEKQVVATIQQSLNNDFQSGFKLTTGLSMEVLWKHLRPLVIPNSRVMETLAQMDKLAQRFDALRWKTSISIPELGGIMSSLVKAYHLLLTSDVDGATLVQTLRTELELLEASMGRENGRIDDNKDKTEVEPFMASEFEALRQFKALENLRSGQTAEFMADVDTIVLANHPTTSEMHLATSTTISRPLQTIDYLWGQGDQFQLISDDLSTSLLRKLNGVEDVHLRSLKLLETELPIMGKKIAKSSATICRDQLLDLNEAISGMITNLIATHDETFAAEYNAWNLSINNEAVVRMADLNETISAIARRGQAPSTAHLPTHLVEALSNHFSLASACITTAKVIPEYGMQCSALAWVQFAVGCITLYVPDRAFDPDKRQRLERERHQNTRDTLQKKLSALQRFEKIFSGQGSNLRCQLLETEIEEMGEPPALLQEIYRPEVSELDQLQGFFTNLGKTVVKSDLEATLMGYFSSRDEKGLNDIKLLRSNVAQIIRHLSGFNAYNDITVPVISMLRCLQIGLAMATYASNGSGESSSALSKVTPFLGGGPVSIESSGISSHPIEFLALAEVTVTTEKLTSFEKPQQDALLKTFHECFTKWDERLKADREAAESSSGLYRFRGSAEDEDEVDEEQFNELFPAYDEESSSLPNGISSSNTARDTAVSIARVHANIFLGAGTPSDSILAFIRQMAKQISAQHEDGTQSDQRNMTASILPGTLLLLNDEIEALSPTAAVLESYNFYTDANLPEARKLVTLVHQIQNRFRELQAVDEIAHMQTLEDVLASCRDLLNFRHTDPLAKIITKVEKVHEFLHEWQHGGWASRVNSALPQYDNLTSTIVSWRRLELSTWAKLFDMETKKCEDAARAWWFFAYQIIIAAPLGIAGDAEELRYAQRLLGDLETYFKTAVVGQFVEQLQLLKQLQKHLELLIIDEPAMAVVHSSLSNFISLYARYEKPVQENLQKGRASLEKSMKDVLLLASWKDTNIVALKDSAKRSHHKLFKIVRKFRALLGQPMEFIIKQGIPDETPAEVQDSYRAPVLLPTVDQSALALCATSVPNWAQKSKRFVNVSKTVSMMVDASQLPDSAVDGSSYLDSFLGNIITSTAELQKTTPLILDEDSKDTVKHLKSRKRKLFADTLKELRQMGIKYNLSADALAKQESLSISLASAQNLHLRSNVDISGLEYYFHKSIDLAPLARDAAQKHSEDLSSAEVARSTGFLEGILQTLLTQHNTLSGAVTSLSKLEISISMAKGLWAPSKYDLRRSEATSNHEKLLLWLPNVLNVGLDLIKIHSKLGKIDSVDIQNTIMSWKGKFDSLSTDWDSLPPLPPLIVSTERLALGQAITSSAQQLTTQLSALSDDRPDLAFIINQIVPWTDVASELAAEDLPEKTITDLDSKLSTVCDTILVAIEKHKKATTDLPSSTDDPNWLVKNDTSLANSIGSLHSDNIISQIGEAFNILRCLNLKDSTTSKTAGAVFTVALPIFQQYFNILQQSVIRYAQLHRTTCKTSYILTKTFIQIATQGFCTPSEKSDAQDGKTEKLEGGTGLGEGEGAEDISKDIQDDENLDELAQEPNTGEKGEMEDEKDAVDMADGDMEGEMGEGEEQGSEDGGSDGEDNADEMDEEAGDVDDLDPTAVDEKMWDGDGEQAEKYQEGDDSKGKQSKDEQVAAQENDKQGAEGDEGEDEEEMAGAEQGEEVKQDEVEKHDPHAQESEALDLPEDMELDGNEEEGEVSESDDGMNDLSDVEQDEVDDEVVNDGQEQEGAENMDQQEDQEIGSDMDVADVDEKQPEGDKTEEAGETVDEPEQPPEDQEGLLRDRSDEANVDADAIPSDVQGVGEDQDENSVDRTESASKAQREDGGKGGDSSEQKDVAAEDGEKGRQANGEAPQDSMDDTQDSSSTQPFKKLGEALERWHRQQTKIQEPSEQKDEQNIDVNTENNEFQHLQDENAQADTQALGTATEEQAHALDESMAVDSESKEMPEQFQPDEAEKDDIDHDMMDVDEPLTPQEEPSDAYEGRAGAMINQAKENRSSSPDDHRIQPPEDLEENIEEVDTQLESTHLDVTTLRTAADARQQWKHYESLTRDLSLSLTEQLRLILAPTLATKMRGDFRTGKRLNIKRIIPYIASQYKRDKIWMRRSVPSKRSYQIMLAVDDSKSMGESGSGSLAFETLVMVSKSLSMLEVGEICVVGFGEDVKVAHDFETPFSSNAGPKIFQNFGFEQRRTDVTRLVRESIELFRAARQKSSNADLWQMELIISDGVCDSSEHEAIRRLLREALEERIMVIFVIVDDVRNKRKGESVMDLKEAKFLPDDLTGVTNLKFVRYLDTFPFQNYLVVSDVKELPGVLATLLRQWFAEVVDSSS